MGRPRRENRIASEGQGAIDQGVTLKEVSIERTNRDVPLEEDGSIAAPGTMISTEEAQAAGALSEEAAQKNRDRAKVVDAKRKGVKGIAWGTGNAVELFSMVRDVWSSGMIVRVERTQPNQIHFEKLDMGRFTSGDDLYAYIKKHFHKASVEATYKVSYVLNSSNQVRATGTIVMPDTTEEGISMNQPPPGYPPNPYAPWGYPPPGAPQGYPPPPGHAGYPPPQPPPGYYAAPQPPTQPQPPAPPPVQAPAPQPVQAAPPPQQQPPQQPQYAPYPYPPYPPPGYPQQPAYDPYAGASGMTLNVIQELRAMLQQKDQSIVALQQQLGDAIARLNQATAQMHAAPPPQQQPQQPQYARPQYAPQGVAAQPQAQYGLPQPPPPPGYQYAPAPQQAPAPQAPLDPFTALAQAAEKITEGKKMFRTLQGLFDPPNESVDPAPSLVPHMPAAPPPVTVVSTDPGNPDAPMLSLKPDGDVHWGMTIMGNIAKVPVWGKKGIDMAVETSEKLERAQRGRAGFPAHTAQPLPQHTANGANGASRVVESIPGIR